MTKPLQDIIAATLQFLNHLTGSVGIAVILLTVLIRVVLHPLNRWSLRAMKRMQALAPQIEVLRRKYKDNPQQMNAEIMHLYRSSGANPFGGCLPTLIQFPVLIAFFQVLRRTDIFSGQGFLGIPLGEAPCTGKFLPNFSQCLTAMAQNPLFVLLPILVGITTYWQQRMTVTDPQQARMFAFMPIMLTLFSLTFPAGLSLYWVVSTALYIGEYLLVVGSPRRPKPALARREGAEADRPAKAN